jgi:hypothetical protein
MKSLKYLEDPVDVFCIETDAIIFKLNPTSGRLVALTPARVMFHGFGTYSDYRRDPRALEFYGVNDQVLE